MGNLEQKISLAGGRRGLRAPTRGAPTPLCLPAEDPRPANYTSLFLQQLQEQPQNRYFSNAPTAKTGNITSKKRLTKIMYPSPC